jgi:hypothetical protein
MMYLLAWALSLTLLSAPTQGRATKVSGDADRDNQLLSRYSSCVIKRHAKDVTKFLLALNWDTKKNSQLQAFSQRTAGCLRENQQVNVDDNLIRGIFAGALFVKQNDGKTLPDYSTVPAIFDEITISQDAKFRLAPLSLAECVFRADPQSVNLLLKSESSSDVESSLYGDLAPSLDRCGSTRQSKVNTLGISLRGVLGEAAYAVSQRHQLLVAESVGGK